MTETSTERHEAVVMVHGTAFSAAETRFLTEAGVHILKTRTVGDAMAVLKQRARTMVIVLPLSVGGRGPEQIVKAVQERRAAGLGEVHVVPTSGIGRSNLRRAQALGLERVFSWPDGAFSEVARLVSAAPSVVVRRFAERAPAARALGLHFGAGLDAHIINISATGAMLDCDATGAQVESIGLEFAIAGVAQPPIFAKVVWREQRAERVRLGLQFVDVSESTKRAIDRFVEDTNVMRVGGARAEQRFTPHGGHKVRVHHGKRRDYFRLEDDDGALILVPPEPFFVPWEIGDTVEVVPTSSLGGTTRFRARIVARQQRDPDRIDSRIAWLIERDHRKPGAADDARQTLTGMEQLEAVVGPMRPSHWTPLASAVDRLVDGTDPFAGASHFIVVPTPPQAASEGLAARTFTLGLQGKGSLLLYHEHDRYMALPTTDDVPFRVTLGRDSTADIPIANASISKVHALLHWEPAARRWLIEDVGSSNGTHLRREVQATDERAVPVGTPVAIERGNVLRLGKQRLHLVSADELRAACALLLARRRAAAHPARR